MNPSDKLFMETAEQQQEIIDTLLEACKGLQSALMRVLDQYNPDSIEYEWISHSNEAINKAESK